MKLIGKQTGATYNESLRPVSHVLDGACKAFRSSAVACPVLLRRLLLCNSNAVCQAFCNSHCTDVAAKQSNKAGVSWNAV